MSLENLAIHKIGHIWIHPSPSVPSTIGTRREVLQIMKRLLSTRCRLLFWEGHKIFKINWRISRTGLYSWKDSNSYGHGYQLGTDFCSEKARKAKNKWRISRTSLYSRHDNIGLFQVLQNKNTTRGPSPWVPSTCELENCVLGWWYTYCVWQYSLIQWDPADPMTQFTGVSPANSILYGVYIEIPCFNCTA